MGYPRKQNGVALVVSLLMLSVMMLLAVTAIRSSEVSLRIVANVQSQQIAEEDAERAIETVLSSADNFQNPHAVTYNPSSDSDGLTTTVSKADCLSVRPAPGYSARMPNAPEETTWEVTASANDDRSGARTEVHQGVKIIMTAGNCT